MVLETGAVLKEGFIEQLVCLRRLEKRSENVISYIWLYESLFYFNSLAFH